MRPPISSTRSAFSARAFSFGLIGEADLAAIVRVLAVERAGAAELRGDRQIEALGEAQHGGGRLVRPAGTADDGDRALGRPQPLLQFRHLRQARPDRRGFGARRVDDLGDLGQHVLGQRDDHRAGAALHGDSARRAARLRGFARRSSISVAHFVDRAEHGAIVHLLKGAAAAHRPLDLADEQDHRRAVVLGDMDAMRGVGGAGAARDEADSRPPGQPARRSPP